MTSLSTSDVIVAMANTAQQAMELSSCKSSATVKGEMCPQGGWKNSGVQVQMLLILLCEQSCIISTHCLLKVVLSHQRGHLEIRGDLMGLPLIKIVR